MLKFLKRLLISLSLPNFYYFLAIAESLKIIFKGNFSNYTGLTPLNALNNLFYIVQNLNLKKFSRKGVSSVIGGGNYKLSNWWHIPNFSHYLFTLSPVVSVLWGSLFIVIWFFYIDISVNEGILYSILPLLSTIFYTNVIRNQNYNIFGLIIISPILYFLINNDTILFVLSSILLPIISPTVFIIFSPIVFFYSLFSFNFLFFFYCTLIPLIFINILYFKKDSIASEFLWMLNAMGLFKSKSKLHREQLSFKKINLGDVYYLFSYFVAIYCLNYIQSSYTYFCIYIFIIHIINRKLLKFSDDENISSVFCITFITLLIVSKSASIFSFILAFIALYNPIINLQKISPINTCNIISKLENFIGNNKKPLLLCFSNPKNIYEKVFDGQRILVEPISYICSRNYRLLIPDWWAVFNQSNLNNFWVDNKHDLMKVIRDFNISEVISTSIKTDQFLNDSFIQTGSLNWNNIYLNEFGADLRLDLDLKNLVIWKKYKIE